LRPIRLDFGFSDRRLEETPCGESPSTVKHLFLAVFVGLVGASLATWLSMPGMRSDVPVIYWVTDPNPARVEQVALFHQWMEKNGYPRCELRVDTANNTDQKKLIQGVSGVGGEIMDVGTTMRYLNAVGLLEDVTEAARKLGCDPSKTYPALESQIAIDGRQYLFPCNVFVQLYWVNKSLFRKYGLPLPPKTWDFETFERLGRQFVQAANRSADRLTVFFADRAQPPLVDIMRRSLGLSIFNETGTGCALDDPRHARVLRLILKWTKDDHILPSAADEASFSVEAGYGGAVFQLFNSGNYAMIRSGRHVLIQLREFGRLELGVSHLPCAQLDNTLIQTRAAAVYRGASPQRKSLAEYFQAFLDSEEYNLHIVKDADGLPPDPQYTRIEAFLRPPDYPNEWGCHEAFAEAARTIAIAPSFSPFVLDTVVNRIEIETLDAVLAGLYSPEEAVRLEAQRIQREIELCLSETPSLQARFQELLARQQEIDRRLAEGKKIPLGWIENPFHARYYAEKGLVE